ncbi:hypothetical protein HDK77DRAFT_179529 [Phyllosticta capitalensis]|uniref:Secreted protein n=1 Tax=Phyllosticta capitalensis TaxID=121624 RepID=A0ABR1YV46_9PEZI
MGAPALFACVWRVAVQPPTFGCGLWVQLLCRLLLLLHLLSVPFLFDIARPSPRHMHADTDRSTRFGQSRQDLSQLTKGSLAFQASDQVAGPLEVPQRRFRNATLSLCGRDLKQCRF